MTGTDYLSLKERCEVGVVLSHGGREGEMDCNEEGRGQVERWRGRGEGGGRGRNVFCKSCYPYTHTCT